MTDVTATTSAATTSSTATTSTASTTPGLGADFTSFIELLTAQVRNQDPLAPMDSTQFVEQLATFSSLEQLVQSNDSLASIASMFSELLEVVTATEESQE